MSYSYLFIPRNNIFIQKTKEDGCAARFLWTNNPSPSVIMRSERARKRLRLETEGEQQIYQALQDLGAEMVLVTEDDG